MNTMFARRHYEAIAAILRTAHFATADQLVEDFADMFERDNSNFSRAHFLAACYPPEKG